jgi:short subunit dehydrogenase-like uncharacterized protein
VTSQQGKLDIVVFGATSFVGRILVAYLVREFGVTGRPTWGIAGRSKSRLEELRAGLGAKAARLPVIVADAADEAALGRLCARARVVVSTVGPYALHGEPLVRTCAESGTDYCDLTGEPHWIRRMLDRYEKTARRTGARIVHSCGFDSVPSDFGVHVLQREAVARDGRPLSRVSMRVRSMSGGFSGGTAASALNAFREVAEHPDLRKELANPYSLCPRSRRPKTRQPNVKFAEYDADFGAWVAPFVMGAINVRIVHRTNALRHEAYGDAFRYDEAILTGRGLRGRALATAIATGLGGFALAASVGPLRAALERFVLPAPGTGPSPEAQKKGRYDLRFLGTDDDGRRLRLRVTGEGDPGYGSTSRILGQAATCLAVDRPRRELPGGFWTPATAFGDGFVDRLERHAGLTFEILDD